VSAVDWLWRLPGGALVLTMLVAGPPGRWGAATWEDELLPGRAVRELHLDVERGDVTLLLGPVARIRRAAPAWASALDLRHHLEAGRLRLSARCRVLTDCPVTHVITAPEHTRVRLRMGQGTLRAVGVAHIDAQISRGDAIVSDPRELRLAVGSGRVRLSARAPVRVEVSVSEGDVDAALPASTAALGLVGRELSLEGIELKGAQPADPAIRLAAPGGRVQVVGLGPTAAPQPAPW
jgi:hypothetical protein